MLTRLFMFVTALLLAKPLFSQTGLLSVYFQTGQAELTESEKEKLRDFAMLHQSASLNIQLKAFTDADGDFDYNIRLSEKRAETVKNYLNEHGLEIKSTLCLGESEPIAPNDSEQGKALNRCVQLNYQINQNPAVSQRPKGYESLEQLMQELKPEEELHCINNRKDTILICNKGTALAFKAYCFEDYDPFQCVEIRITEAHRRSDMLLSGLNTKSGPDWLVSGGMVAVNAYQNGRLLSMASDKPASIFLPSENPDERMRLFYSAHDDINWQLDENANVYTWNRGAQGRNRTNFRNREGSKCRFFMCRISRAFVRKANRFPLDDEGRFIFNELTVDNNLNMKEMREVFGDVTLNELNERLQKANKLLSDMNYYAFQSSRLGYINCDYFLGSRENLIVANTNSPRDILANINMVFKKENVIMPGTMADLGAHKFHNVPKDAPVVIIGIGIKDGEPVLAFSDSELSRETTLEYEPCSAEDIKRRVKFYLD